MRHFILYNLAWGSRLIRKSTGKRGHCKTLKLYWFITETFPDRPCQEYCACVHEFQITMAINLLDQLVFIKHLNNT